MSNTLMVSSWWLLLAIVALLVLIWHLVTGYTVKPPPPVYHDSEGHVLRSNRSSDAVWVQPTEMQVTSGAFNPSPYDPDEVVVMRNGVPGRWATDVDTGEQVWEADVPEPGQVRVKRGAGWVWEDPPGQPATDAMEIAADRSYWCSFPGCWRQATYRTRCPAHQPD